VDENSDPTRAVKILVALAIAAAGVALILVVIDNHIKNSIISEARKFEEMIGNASTGRSYGTPAAAGGYVAPANGTDLADGDELVPNPHPQAAAFPDAPGGGLKAAPRQSSPQVRARLNGDGTADGQ
jgi:hypothetical protein